MERLTESLTVLCGFLPVKVAKHKSNLRSFGFDGIYEVGVI